ncbi:MAG: tetratricopeptide repeat protein [Chloroflexota bacterium]
MAYTPMQLAEAFLKTGELEDALDALNQQLEAEPADEEARRLRVQVLMRLRQPEHLAQAMADMDAISQKTATDWQTHSILAMQSGDAQSAIDAIQQARTLAPDDERLTERLLDLLLKAAQYDEALALVREQERTWRWLEREGDVLVLLGDDMLATARYGLVLAQLEQFKDTMREDYWHAFRVRALLARAHAYRRLEHSDPAREHYLAAQAILGDDVSIMFNLGLLQAQEGHIEDAITRCKAAYMNASETLQAEMMRSLIDDDYTLQQIASALAN